MYGGTMGSPIKKNKRFFFSSYEQWFDHRPITVKITLPTAEERQGDFSKSRIGSYTVCATGTTCARPIYDPISATGSSGVRTIFGGNIILTTRFDPTADKLLEIGRATV